MSLATTVRDVRAVSDDASAALVLLGELLTPHVSGALWWGVERTLVVSDLHLEKGSSFAARGVSLPPYDTRETLDQLEAVVALFAPKRVIALGDSFHDRGLDGRMAAVDRMRLCVLVGSVDEWVWIAGNHDPRPSPRIGGVAREVYRAGPLVFRHEPTGARGDVAGHLHPCARVVGRGSALRRRCFVADGARLVMPAFGAFTGGLNVCDAAFDAAFPESAPLAYVLGRDHVWPVDGASLRPD